MEGGKMTMKRNQFIVLVLFLAAGLFAPMGCETNIEPEKQQKLEGPVMLTMEGFTPQTKTSVSGASVVWENGDVVNLNGKDYTVQVNGDQAYVNATDITVGNPIYGYYGCTFTSGQSTTPTVTIPASYTCSFSGGRQIIPLPMAAYSASAGNTVTFKHLTAAVEVTVWNATASTLYVESVSVTAKASRLNGDLTLDFTAADFGIAGDNVSVPEANRSVTVSFPTPLEIAPGAENATSIQIPIIPMADDNLTINVASHNADIAGVPVTGLTHVFNHQAPAAALGRNVMLSAKVKMSPQSTNVKSKGTFSVSDTKAVYFSKGNLQATATNVDVTNKTATWTWGFADHQYSFVGGSHSDPLGTDFTPTGNNYVTNQEPWITQNGTVDLFGWVGTRFRDNRIQGWAEYGICSGFSSSTWSNFGEGESFMHEWGSLIGENWFTLSSDEWNYLLYNRGKEGYAPCSTLTEGGDPARWFKAVVADICGIVIFPDDFTWPSNLEMKQGLVDNLGYALPKLNNENASYSSENKYIITADEWLLLEDAGCVFLPAAGYRESFTSLVKDFSGVSDPSAYGPLGKYWSSNGPNDNSYCAYALYISNSSARPLSTPAYGRNDQGKSVRLAYPAN